MNDSKRFVTGVDVSADRFEVDIIPWSRLCIINGDGDLVDDRDVREYIGQECYVLGVNQGGMIRVQLASDDNKVKLFASRNVDMVCRRLDMDAILSDVKASVFGPGV
jgi:hypothetical protein